MEELEVQLNQMRAALVVASDEDKPALESIIKDLESLINPDVDLTATSLESEFNLEEQDEYSLFQAEIAALDANSETTSSSTNGPSSSTRNDQYGDELEDSGIKNSSICISDELAALEGMKCLAPHEESWGQIGYYPAMISQVVSTGSSESDSENDESGTSTMDLITVRVVFLQPVVKSQLFCPFFKEDRCRFADDDCRYSHGEVVPLSSLREYIEPDYSKIVPNSRVLAKYADDLWYKATITRLTHDGNCEVQFDKDKELNEVSMHETSPLSTDSGDSESDSDMEEEEEINSDAITTSTTLYDSEQIMNMNGTEALGDWERYTKGFGSKLMMKMGYVMGSGLGKKAEGRINPVDAVIVPLGMSLDKYMEMKEKVGGGNKNWFSVEKRLKRAQKKHSDKEKQLAREKKNKPPSVFEFINSQLGLRKPVQTHSKKSADNIRKQSSLNLNKRMLDLGESMNKVTKDVRKVREAMKRLEGRDPTTHAAMKEKLEALEKQQQELSRMENSVAREQKHRSDKKKLVEF